MAKHRTNSLDFDESTPWQHIPGQSPVLVLDYVHVLIWKPCMAFIPGFDYDIFIRASPRSPAWL